MTPDRRGVILAADHRARGLVTVENYGLLLSALGAALPFCDGLMATVKPLADLTGQESTRPLRTYLSLNRTGLAGSTFELDDRLVASVDKAARDGHTGVKLMVRIDRLDPSSSAGLELLGRVLEQSERAGLEALVEPLSWRSGGVDRTVEGIVLAAVIAHDMGAPVLKVPVPDTPPGSARSEAVARIVASVGVPVMFLGGPRGESRRVLISELADAVSGGAAGAVIGRAVYQDPRPDTMAKLVSDLVHSRMSADQALEEVDALDADED